METGMLTSAALAWLAAYKYAIVFPLTIIEGPVVMVATGFLWHLGYFSFWPLYLILLAGDLVADFLWYAIGFYGARPLSRRYGRFVNLTDETLDKIETQFRKHQNKILIISKLTMGFGFALVTLMIAGASRVPLKKYAALNILGGFIWTGALLALGYFFGNLYSLIDGAFRNIFIVALVALFVLALYGFRQYMRKRLLKNEL